MQESHQSFVIQRPINDVYAFVNDLERSGRCIAGVKEARVTGPGESEWKVAVSAGLISQTLTIKVHITEARDPELIAFVGDGRNVKLTGTFRLKPIDTNSTDCQFDVVIDSKGPLAMIVDTVMGHTAQKLAIESVANFKKALDRPTVSAPS